MSLTCATAHFALCGHLPRSCSHLSENRGQTSKLFHGRIDCFGLVGANLRIRPQFACVREGHEEWRGHPYALT